MGKQNIHENQEQCKDQNVTFGTFQKPEGFVATWRKASHLWRFRAVLCIVLSLMLTMMQPAGNALYRSWNVSIGDTTGFAIANESTEQGSVGGLVPASVSSMTASSANMTTAGLSDYAHSKITFHSYPNLSTYGFDYCTITFS